MISEPTPPLHLQMGTDRPLLLEPLPVTLLVLMLETHLGPLQMEQASLLDTEEHLTIQPTQVFTLEGMRA